MTSAADIDLLLRSYDKFRSLAFLSPTKLLKRLRREIRDVVDPYVLSLVTNAEIECSHLRELTEHVSQAETNETRSAERDFKRTSETAAKIQQEIERASSERDRVGPNMPKYRKLTGTIEALIEEYDFTIRRLKASRQNVDLSKKRLRQLLPGVTKIQHRVYPIQTKLMLLSLRLLVWNWVAVFISLMPTLIAASVTLALDRMTPVAEAIAARLAPTQYHIVVVLAFFAVQAGLQAPFETIRDQLSWRGFDRAVDTIRSLLPDMRLSEDGIHEAQAEIPALLSEWKRSIVKVNPAQP